VKFLDRVKHKAWFVKLFHWEYWPSLAFYWLLLFLLPIDAVRSRHGAYFMAANPGIDFSGLGLESKMATVEKIPPAVRPVTVLVHPHASSGQLTEQLNTAGLQFPLIAKPNIGYRGLLVRKIRHLDELIAYLQRYPTDFLLQELLDFPEEIGVLYYRFPDASQGDVTSLTLKEFLALTGDGRHSIRQLAEKDERAILQLQRLETQMGSRLERVPAAGERVPLGIVGNHAKGTRFINGHAQIDDRLRAVMDRLAGQIEGFYYGRFDIKCESLESFKNGGPFKVIEVNGICSEPTHIYDPHRISYPGALRTIIRHWKLIRKISEINRRKGHPCMPVLQLAGCMRRHLGYIREMRAYAEQ